MSINPNDLSAKYYDQVYYPFKDSILTHAEVDLVSSLVSPKSTILDLGCGTGRHLCELAQLGHQVVGVDTSREMLKQAKRKFSELGISPNEDTATQTFPSLFSSPIEEVAQLSNWKNKITLITLFWNAWNEICLDEIAAGTVLKACMQLLTPQGQILINIDNPGKINLPNLDFSKRIDLGNLGFFTVDWQVINFDEQTHTTTSLEQIQKHTADGVLSESSTAEITQRWWSFTEIQALAESSQLTVSKISFPENEELYLTLRRK